MSERFDPGRRRFIGLTALLAGRAVLPNGHEKLADILDPQSEDFENPVEDEVKERVYPKTEEVPVLMQNYARQFSSWPEVVKDQRIKTLSFIESDIYKDFISQSLREAFPEKESAEIAKLQQDLISDKLREVKRTRVRYKRLINKGLIGLYKGKTANLDTIFFEKHDLKEVGDKKL